MRVWPLFLLVFFAAPGFGGAAAESLTYQGESTLYMDTVWEGDVQIDGILTVAPGVALEIRPGTTVRFVRRDSNGDGIGESEIYIQGTLRALGTAQAPVRFTSAEEKPVAGDWGAINMMASEEGNRLEHCLVEYAYRGFHAHFASASLVNSAFLRNVQGIQFQEATVEIDRCRISDNRNGIQFRDSTVRISDTAIVGNYWGLRCVYSEVVMVGNRVEKNLLNGANLRDSVLEAENNRVTENRRGLYLQRSRGKVKGNLLGDNSEHGILLEETEGVVTGNRIVGNGRAGVKIIDAEVELSGNDLARNGEYDLINDGSGTVVARDNWWGTLAPMAISGRIRDRADRPGTGPVDATSPLTVQPHIPKDGFFP